MVTDKFGINCELPARARMRFARSDLVFQYDSADSGTEAPVNGQYASIGAESAGGTQGLQHAGTDSYPLALTLGCP